MFYFIKNNYDEFVIKEKPLNSLSVAELPLEDWFSIRDCFPELNSLYWEYKRWNSYNCCSKVEETKVQINPRGFDILVRCPVNTINTIYGNDQDPKPSSSQCSICSEDISW